jgi:acetyl-CoA C-acetyltransferase
MQSDPIVIASYARTPIGNLLGELKSISATDLGAAVIKAAVTRANLMGDDIHEVIMGCVLPAGLGQAPARQAAIAAGIPYGTPCTTINKVCGSSMKAVMFGHDMLLAGTGDIMVVGGMESMTNAPYLLKKARDGYRLGHGELYDHMMLDGLEDAYDKGRPMGYFGESCVKQFGFTREQQDAFSIESLKRAREAEENKLFAREIVPLTVKSKQGDVIITKDEKPFSVNPDKIPKLNPAFLKDGTITAGNSSSIADGAAALTIMRQSVADKRGIQPIARIIGHASFAKLPAEFTTAPIDATRALLTKIGWKAEEVDLYEVNEAFAVVAMAFMHELKIPREKINIHGGACALGHPIGASGARIIVTLLAAMQERKVKRGVATLCIGGGEATAVAVELLG